MSTDDGGGVAVSDCQAPPEEHKRPGRELDANHGSSQAPLPGLKGRELELTRSVNRLDSELNAAHGALAEAVDFVRSHREITKTVGRIAEAATGCSVLQLFCTTVAHAVADFMKSPDCSVMLLDDDSTSFRLCAHHEDGESNPPRVIPKGLAAQVAFTAKPQVINDLSQSDNGFDSEGRAASGSMALLPLSAGTGVIGLIKVGHPQPGQFTSARLRPLEELFEIAGHLVALAANRETMARRNQALTEDMQSKETRMRETQVEMANREKLAVLGETVSGLAHEVNNRLLPVTVYAESLLESRLPEKQAEQVRVMADAVAGVKGVLKALLGFARKCKPQKVAVDLNDLLRRTLAVLRLSLERERISVETDLEPSVGKLMVDPIQIEQVMVNLVRNAQHAIRAGEPEGGGRIRVCTRLVETNLVILVDDNGCGISQDIKAKIMEPFFSTKPPGEGSGLGLSVSYGIISGHGGEITFHSQPGDTTFIVSFPCVRPDTSEDAVREGSGASAVVSDRRWRVLAIDDDEIVLEAVREVLETKVNADCVSSGERAVEMLSQSEYDVIVSDMRMPGMNGRDIHAWLKQNHPGMERRMVFATGDTLDPRTYEFIMANSVTCVPKPFTPKSLLAAIAETVKREGAADSETG